MSANTPLLGSCLALAILYFLMMFDSRFLGAFVSLSIPFSFTRNVSESSCTFNIDPGERAYEVGEVAWDDFKQEISILGFLYPETNEDLKQPIHEVDNMKQLINRDLSRDIESLPKRDYEKVEVPLENFNQIQYCLDAKSVEK